MPSSQSPTTQPSTPPHPSGRLGTRALTGIGILLLAITFIIVAASAAYVIFTSTNLVHHVAQATATDSTTQVSNQLRIFGTTGTVNATTDTLTHIHITTGVAPGGGAIALNETTLDYMDSQTETTLTRDALTVTTLNDDDASLTGDRLNSNTDRARLTLNLTAIPETSALTGDEQVTLTFTTASGAQTTTILTVPAPLYAGSGDTIISL